jgi:hypothetical protein
MAQNPNHGPGPWEEIKRAHKKAQAEEAAERESEHMILQENYQKLFDDMNRVLRSNMLLEERVAHLESIGGLSLMPNPQLSKVPN